MLCNQHRNDHLFILTEHSIKVFKLQLNQESISEIEKSIFKKIEILDEYTNKLIKDTQNLISKLKSMEESAKMSISNIKSYYLSLLKDAKDFQNEATTKEINKLEENLNRKFSCNKFLDINHYLNIIDIFYYQKFLPENIFENPDPIKSFIPQSNLIDNKIEGLCICCNKVKLKEDFFSI